MHTVSFINQSFNQSINQSISQSMGGSDRLPANHHHHYHDLSNPPLALSGVRCTGRLLARVSHSTTWPEYVPLHPFAYAWVYVSIHFKSSGHRMPHRPHHHTTQVISSPQHAPPPSPPTTTTQVISSPQHAPPPPSPPPPQKKHRPTHPRMRWGSWSWNLAVSTGDGLRKRYSGLVWWGRMYDEQDDGGASVCVCVCVCVCVGSYIERDLYIYI